MFSDLGSSVFCFLFCCLGCQSSIHGEEKKVEYEDAKTGGLVLKMLSGGVCGDTDRS